ncbi:MAG: RluA family pseudouridine synthase [Lachnospiraceae bacterium]|nr:RluA family pseudouridine synthase [Lachnospiraceae bacterium]
MLRKKNITLNGRKASGPELLSEGDVITIWFSEDTFAKFSGRRSAAEEHSAADPDRAGGMPPLKVLYEDDDILVIDKPAGLLSQKAASNDVSVNELLAEHLGADRNDASQAFRPAACHRLDRNTTGALVCGKSYRGLKEMTELIRTREVKKEYLCLVRGCPEAQKFTLRDMLVKDEAANTVYIADPGAYPAAGDAEDNAGDTAADASHAEPREAVLTAEVLASAGGVSLLKVLLETGRSHQIRVQLAHAGYPLLGDIKYGAEKMSGVKALPMEKKIRRPMLHAYAVTIPGPAGTVTAPVPSDMRKIMKGAGILWPPGTAED